MIQESAADFPPLGMMLSLAFGLVIGIIFGERNGRRKCLEEANEQLAMNSNRPAPMNSRYQMNFITNARSSKFLENSLPKYNKINSRIIQIRL